MRIALGIEYRGTGFYGWQAQHGLKTIQGELQRAVQCVANEEVFLHCAGRTDAHVHALEQVVHFDTKSKRHVDAWIWGVNAHLPEGISVCWAKEVDHQFHARFSALSRRYRYIIYNHPIQSALLRHHATWYYYPLQLDAMRQAGAYLLGEQDFSSFRSSQCGSRTAMRNVISFDIEQKGHFVIFEIEANAFLHHMVRNIAGTLMKIGSGLRSPEWMREVLLAKSRKVAAETASPDGLYLIKVRYPKQYQFPELDRVFLI